MTLALSIFAALTALAAFLLASAAFLRGADFRARVESGAAKRDQEIQELRAELDRERKQRRILKATLLAARDAHAAKLDEHEARFEHLPSVDGIEALVKQHNAMALDLSDLKERVAPILNGAALRKATGA